MNIAFRIAVLLLAIEIVLGLDAPRTVLFPDESEENFDEFDYDNIHSLDKTPTTKSERRTGNQKNAEQKTTFRVDATDIPCMNSTMYFCEEVTNYPSKYVESIVANVDAQTYEQFFNKTIASETLGLRISNNRPIELCNSIKRDIYPRRAKNLKGEWRLVVNLPNPYRQPIKVEKCQWKNSRCKFSETLPNHYVSQCVQKYNRVALLSLDEYGQVVPYDYDVPSYCQCEIQHSKSERTVTRRWN